MNYPIDKLRLLTLNVGLANHYGDWNWKNVRSPFARLYYVTEGTAQVEMSSCVYTLKPNHLYFIPAYTTHSYICDSKFSHYYIHIYEEQQSETSMFDEWDFPVEVSANNTDLELVKRLCDMNPFLKLPQSNPDTYDNHQTLISNIELNRRRPFSDKVESRGILFILMSRLYTKKHRLTAQYRTASQQGLHVERSLYPCIQARNRRNAKCIHHHAKDGKGRTGTTNHRPARKEHCRPAWLR